MKTDMDIIKEQCDTVNSLLNESSKQHRSRGDVAHATLSERARDIVKQIKEVGR